MLEHEMTNRTAGIHDEGAALRSIVEGTATETGERFFESLVKSLWPRRSTRMPPG